MSAICAAVAASSSTVAVVSVTAVDCSDADAACCAAVARSSVADCASRSPLACAWATSSRRWVNVVSNACASGGHALVTEVDVDGHRQVTGGSQRKRLREVLHAGVERVTLDADPRLLRLTEATRTQRANESGDRERDADGEESHDQRAEAGRDARLNATVPRR